MPNVYHLLAKGNGRKRLTKLWASKDVDDILDQSRTALESLEIEEVVIKCEYIDEDKEYNMDLEGIDGFGISSLLEEFLNLDLKEAEIKANENGMEVRILKPKMLETQEDVDEELYNPLRINFVVKNGKVNCASIG